MRAGVPRWDDIGEFAHQNGDPVAPVEHIRGEDG